MEKAGSSLSVGVNKHCSPFKHIICSPHFHNLLVVKENMGITYAFQIWTGRVHYLNGEIHYHSTVIDLCTSMFCNNIWSLWIKLLTCRKTFLFCPNIIVTCTLRVNSQQCKCFLQPLLSNRHDSTIGGVFFGVCSGNDVMQQ
jgi:hypothetical protein